jgi:hypothetical protein
MALVDRDPEAGERPDLTPSPAPPDPAAHPAPIRPWLGPAVMGATVACGCAAIALIDPGDNGTSVCWSKSLFGVDCPFCGGLRCVNALVRGDWAAAADHNVVLAVALPLVAVAWLVTLVRAVQGRPIRWRRPPTWVLVSGALFLLAFTVARNVGGPGWVEWLNSATYRG